MEHPTALYVLVSCCRVHNTQVQGYIYPSRSATTFLPPREKVSLNDDSRRRERLDQIRLDGGRKVRKTCPDFEFSMLAPAGRALRNAAVSCVVVSDGYFLVKGAGSPPSLLGAPSCLFESSAPSSVLYTIRELLEHDN